jgi:hypothetical protein
MLLRTELVAAILKKGGLMSQSSNPGAATPESLHNMYKNKAAVTGNPYTLRQFNSNPKSNQERSSLLGFKNMLDNRYKLNAHPQNVRMGTIGNHPRQASFKYILMK